MKSFLLDLFSTDPTPRTVVVMDDDSTGAPRQYRVTPSQLLYGSIGVALALVVMTILLTIFSPLERLMPGYEAKEARDVAQRQQVALDALQDSLRLQREYVLNLRGLMGGVGSPVQAGAGEPVDAVRPSSPVVTPSVAASWAGRSARRGRVEASGSAFPALFPIQGVRTRGFDASTGHFAIDIAAEEGSAVRAIEGGFVVLADWTHEGGYTIAVQHSDGFVSIYKHNSSLLRKSGDAVQARDVIALSGNTGEVTTGPHVHLELWRDGVPMDPEAFLMAL